MYFVCKREEDDCKELFGGALGYFWDKESAMDAVHRNATDMRETIYPYAIIERLNQGIFPVPKEREWFGWEEEKDGFYKIATPECAKYFPDGFSVSDGICAEAVPRGKKHPPRAFVLRFHHRGARKTPSPLFKTGMMKSQKERKSLLLCFTPNIDNLWKWG